MAGRRNRYGTYDEISRDALGPGILPRFAPAVAPHGHLFDGSTAQLVSGKHSYAEIPDAGLTQIATAPAFDAVVSTSASTVRKIRRVFGYFTLVTTASDAAVINCLVETSAASGSYNTVVIAQIPNNIAGTFKVPYQFEVVAGLRYKFTKGGASSVTETISAYSYTEW